MERSYRCSSKWLKSLTFNSHLVTQQSEVRVETLKTTKPLEPFYTDIFDLICFDLSRLTQLQSYLRYFKTRYPKFLSIKDVILHVTI